MINFLLNGNPLQNGSRTPLTAPLPLGTTKCYHMRGEVRPPSVSACFGRFTCGGEGKRLLKILNFKKLPEAGLTTTHFAHEHKIYSQKLHIKGLF